MRFLPLLLLACEPPISALVPETMPVQLAFPVQDRTAIGEVIGVDHDPTEHPPGIEAGICTDHQGRAFPYCYDGHKGTDYILLGGFQRMDSDSPQVLAAAAGTVIDTHDGEYDRCRLENLEVVCDGNPRIANTVTVEHEGGLRTRYIHLQRDSVAVEIGDTVECGDTVGRIGSSGNSSLPHLHFEVRDGPDDIVDAYGTPHTEDDGLWAQALSDDGLPAGCP